MDYWSEDEINAMTVLKELKEQAKHVKEKLKKLNHVIDFNIIEKDKNELNEKERTKQVIHAQLHQEWADCHHQLAELRAQWKDWDHKRKQATKVKMIFLDIL